MSEIGEAFDAMREHAREYNQARSERFLLALEGSSIPYKSIGNGVVLIRYGKASVDLYTTRGKWKDNSTGKYLHGDEKSFLNWIGKRIE